MLKSYGEFFLVISENQLKTILVANWKLYTVHSLLWKRWKLCFSVFWEFCSPLVEYKENLQVKYLIISCYSIMFYYIA